MGGKISYRCSRMAWQRILGPRIAVRALDQKKPEAVEIDENFHGLLHGFTICCFGNQCELVDKLP
jgi:hypothetical protein